MSSQMCRSAFRAARTLLSTSKACGNRAAAISLSSKVPLFASGFNRESSEKAKRAWISGALALPVAAYLLREREAHAAQKYQAEIAIQLDVVPQELVSVIILGFQLKGFELVTIVKGPSEEVTRSRNFSAGFKKNLKGSGRVVAMVWEGEGVKEYVENLIKAMSDQKSFGIIKGQLTYASDGVGETGTRSSGAFRARK